MRILSLFSGAGGLDLGLKQSGHQIVWANDSDPDATETYRHNVDDNIILSDINEIDLNMVPSADVVVGGFPCQGFSVANLNRNIDDERNRLYEAFCNAIAVTQPKFFIAENVKGILSLDKGMIIKRIVSDFEGAGYLVNVNKVNMADYGIPQTRQRVVILGQRRDIADSMILSLPKPTHSKSGSPAPWVSISEAIGMFPDPDEPNDILNHICSSYKVEYRNFTGHRQTDPDKPSPTILARGNGKGGVCAIPHYNGTRRLTIRESAAVQTFPDDFKFFGGLGSCYRQIGNAVPVAFGRIMGEELNRIDSFAMFKESLDANNIAI
ncbi:MAG: DNA cytosine methyltransferase [Clostridiales Family XIII bacterium]|jgi:DNA (cytosine-5)-methyltransferase 1|nr:DNA cytosine methyltransferase [Clostridiales Family XIII bacterium]